MDCLSGQHYHRLLQCKFRTQHCWSRLHQQRRLEAMQPVEDTTRVSATLQPHISSFRIDLLEIRRIYERWAGFSTRRAAVGTGRKTTAYGISRSHKFEPQLHGCLPDQSRGSRHCSNALLGSHTELSYWRAYFAPAKSPINHKFWLRRLMAQAISSYRSLEQFTDFAHKSRSQIDLTTRHNLPFSGGTTLTRCTSGNLPDFGTEDISFLGHLLGWALSHRPNQCASLTLRTEVGNPPFS